MSLQNASRSTTRFVARWAKTSKIFGATKAVIDASNLNSKITVQDLGTQPGKLRSFLLNYYPAICDAEGDCSDSVCNSGTRVAPKQQVFTLTRCTASLPFELAEDDVRMIDDGGMSFSEHAQSIIASAMVSMRKVLDQEIIDLLIMNIGLLPDGSQTLRLPLLNGNGAVNPMGMWLVDKTFMDGQFENPYLVGGAQLNYYQRQMGMAGLNQYGQRLDQTPGTNNLYYDELVNPTFADGSDHIIAFDPTVIKFISWSRNAGMFATDMKSITDIDNMYRRGADSSIFGSLIDPAYPLRWDIDIHYDVCNRVFVFQLRLYWDIFLMPDQVCNRQGVTGVFDFEVCKIMIPDCPTDGTALPDPLPLTTYSYTPTVTYPLTVATLKIGNVQTAPNVNVANLDELVAVMNDSASGVTFVKNATAITYQGNSAITGNINGTVNFTFA